MNSISIHCYREYGKRNILLGAAYGCCKFGYVILCTPRLTSHFHTFACRLFIVEDINLNVSIGIWVSINKTHLFNSQIQNQLIAWRVRQMEIKKWLLLQLKLIVKWLGKPNLHPRIEFTHSDTDRVHDHRCLSMGSSYKISRHGEARNAFFLYVELHYLVPSPKLR